jgi:two-component system, OmpR family, response regulator MprA
MAKKILIVEDEKDIRDAMETTLSYEGYEVHVAGDGIEGYTKAHEVKPDLILLDVLMPRQNGIEMLRSLRKEPWGKDIPVIVMTMLDDLERISEAIEAGAQEYLVKSKLSLGGIVEKVKNRLG